MKSRRLLMALTGLLLFATAGRAHNAYLSVYKDHTEHLVIYADFETALNMRATYLTPEFRAAIADERHRVLNATAEDHEKYKAGLQADGELYHEVIFSADSGMAEGDRFGGTDDGWTVRLMVDGKEEKVVSLYKVRKPNAMQRALYPHFNKWSDLWIARFERTITDPKEIKMVVASGYGNGTLVWKNLP